MHQELMAVGVELPVPGAELDAEFVGRLNELDDPLDDAVLAAL
jgi:hypothetical protein